jgi:uncharacterized protein, PH0010 family
MQLDAGDRETLAITARKALDAAVRGESYAPPATERPALLAHCGCFVTLKTGGALRGCLGCFTADQPLYRTVPEYAGHSALDDPRFRGNRVKPEELESVDMEISVLSPLSPCGDPENIRLGIDGVYVRRGGRSGCFLPQVATETGWSVDEFFGHCCRDKAGLEWDAWRMPGTEVFCFTADIFTA